MEPRFSNRTAWDLSPSPLSVAIERARAAGKPLTDLTVSNPTRCGFDYDAEHLLPPLSDPKSLLYDPDPLGLRSAREAVAGYYADHGAALHADQLILTTSTSEAYSFLFRLLCDPGDEVLVAQPSYPLFDFLAALDNITLSPYPLFYDFGWWIDFAALEQRITPRTRAILLVHPNNPTGHTTTREERRRLERICANHSLALIVDEVFLDYPLGDPIESFAAGEHTCLKFVVSGISKIAALPQMKVGWLASFGPGAEAAFARLEVIADTFLSMNAPAQLALPTWLEHRAPIQMQIFARARANLVLLHQLTWAELLPVQAGWSAVLRLRATSGAEDLAERLAEHAGVVVHPGNFYALPATHWLVVSLLVPSESLAEGIAKLNDYFEPGELTSILQ